MFANALPLLVLSGALNVMVDFKAPVGSGVAFRSVTAAGAAGSAANSILMSSRYR